MFDIEGCERMEVTILAAVLLWYLAHHYRKEAKRKRTLARRRRLERRLAYVTATPAFPADLPAVSRVRRPSGCEIIEFPRFLAANPASGSPYRAESANTSRV